MDKICRKVMVTGVVQGVGFRPFIYGLARALGVKGMVQNSGDGVLIMAEGSSELVDKFIREICNRPPALASVAHCRFEDQPPQDYPDFTIEHTTGRATGESVVPPDAATCSVCRKEVFDAADRHYGYPFTNCTNCGPRFTIISKLPYDRQRTSMREFAMCKECAREYGDPADRRFHAQPVACPACGPEVLLVDRKGEIIDSDWIKKTRHLLLEGYIIAVKSLGGFHLACNGKDTVSIKQLRLRKGRPAKPLAVMCRDMETVYKYCFVNLKEKELLESAAAPIVLLQKKRGIQLPEELAPGLNTIGVMLPYTPLHLLLFQDCLDVLVMTSGNPTGLPLVRDNQQALRELGSIADFFLIHNREVVNGCDDSVVKVTPRGVQFLRRSRGYVPRPIELTKNACLKDMDCLGVGGDMKNTFCLVKQGKAYLSQHLGSIDTLEGMEYYKQSLQKFCDLVNAGPEHAGYDLHPGYQSGAIARSSFSGAVGIQHHHAHMASCMAENSLNEEVIGIILDGTGYGPDGNIWGFEVLTGDYLDFKREYHLEYLPLPGGEKAVRNPWITACAYLIAIMREDGYALAKRLFPEQSSDLELIKKMIERNINSPLSSSCGRLFDAAAALLEVCKINTYEGQAATELGELVPPVLDSFNPYPCEISDGVVVIAPLIRALVNDSMGKVPLNIIAKKFHDAVIAIVIECAARIRVKSGLNKVVLSGGCWHNNYLLNGAVELLQNKGFKVFWHQRVPPGDGGIALGQALIVYHRLAAKK